MLVLNYLCFAIFVKHTFAYVIFPAAIDDLRFKRQAPCGGHVDVSGGTKEIKLPTELFNGTEFYRANEDCTWKVTTSPNHYMILKSGYFYIEVSENCVWDYFEITESGNDGVSTRFCGWDPMNYITAGHEITLHFRSDDTHEDMGFTFIIESKQRDADETKCDSSIIGGEDSKIMNKVEVGTGCFYRIQAPKDKVIELNLKMHDFGSAACEEESVVVYNGLTTHGEPLATICSDAVDGIQPYHVNTMFIEYRNPLQREGERFTIEYSFVEDIFTPPPTPSTTPSPVGGNNVCSGMYKGTEKDFPLTYTAPEYEDDKECIVVVRNDLLPRFVVQIEFLYFDIEDSENCIFDSLKIKSGERNDSATLGGLYCAQSLQDRTFVTSGNSLRLEFKTDDSLALRGFSARISFVPSTDCTCEGNQICIRQDYEKICIRGQECRENMCQNGGTCVKTGDIQKCYCGTGFSGDDCSQSDGEKSQHISFKRAPADRSLKRDESHHEECAVDILSGTEVQYDWTFNGALIGAYNSKSGFGTHPGGLLQIDKFTDRLEGQYSCFARTSAGTAEQTFEYRIVENCDVKIFPGPQSQTLNVNEKALMICYVPGAKEVRWKKDGVYIDDNKDSRFTKMTNNFLQIMDIRLSDAGKYTCEAEDNYGCYSYKEGELTVVNVKPLNDYCGKSVHDEYILARSRISKGRDARPNENPWVVTFINSGTNRAFCGGTLISQSYILTAAHCIEEFEQKVERPWASENVYFFLGTTNCNKKGDEKQMTFRSYTVHPNYNNATYDSDIALIELDSPVQYTDAIRPICLQPGSYNDEEFLEKSDSLQPVPGKVAGCGYTRERLTKDGKPYGTTRPSQLQVLHLPYVSRDECEESLERRKEKITDRMFCAGSNIAGKGDACGGDSGNGLVMADRRGRWVQTGIVSWGLGACDKNKYYGVYTNVGRFYDWIEGIAKFSEEEVQF